MKIFLIRHGESSQNTKENYSVGLPDHKVPLTEKGIEQANKAGLFLVKYVNEHNIDLSNARLWVSPYERTRRTAQEINKHLQIQDVKEDITLIEQRYGLFSDKEIELIKQLYPAEFAHYDNYYQNEGKFYAVLPQGEAPFDVALRTKQFIDTIFRDDNDPLFVVSHGTTIKTFILNWMHYSPEWFAYDKTMDNCAIRLITRDDNTKQSTEEYIYGGPKLTLKKKD
jgi:broad specificity phosphatase PhoE